MPSLLQQAALAPHGFCLAWEPALIFLHVSSDALIAVAYFSIPLALAVFLRRRKDVAFRWIFVAFAAFILACGATHVAEIVVLWRPDYWTQGIIKAVTAIASVITAVALWSLLPEVVTLPSPTALRKVNEELSEQIGQREAALAALRQETAERMRTEAMFQQAQKMEALGQLTGGVAHDFNNLLMVVQGNLEVLGNRVNADDPIRRYIERATLAAIRGGTLTQQLLAFARRQNLQPSLFDVNARIRELPDLLAGTLGRSVIVDARSGDATLMVEADPHQLETALLNLGINARDAMPSGGHLEITTDTLEVTAPTPAVGGEMEAGCYVRIRVRDTGTGMPPEVRESAFEPFFTTKPPGQGTGLGLSQVYGFVRQSNGHILLESEPGHGTTISLLLPRADRLRSGRQEAQEAYESL